MKLALRVRKNAPWMDFGYYLAPVCLYDRQLGSRVSLNWGIVFKITYLGIDCEAVGRVVRAEIDRVPLASKNQGRLQKIERSCLLQPKKHRSSKARTG
jgi:hypothetical protein